MRGFLSGETKEKGGGGLGERESFSGVLKADVRGRKDRRGGGREKGDRGIGEGG